MEGLFGILKVIGGKIIPSIGELFLGAMIGSNTAQRLFRKVGVVPGENGGVEVKNDGHGNSSDEEAWSYALSLVHGKSLWKTKGLMVIKALETLEKYQQENFRANVGKLTTLTIVKKVTKSIETPNKKPGGKPVIKSIDQEERFEPAVEYLLYLAEQKTRTDILRIIKVGGMLEHPEEKLEKAAEIINKLACKINTKPYKGFWKTLLRIPANH